jgi:hypothetical protein
VPAPPSALPPLALPPLPSASWFWLMLPPSFWLLEVVDAAPPALPEDWVFPPSIEPPVDAPPVEELV